MKNTIKQQLQSGSISIGTWISIGHPDVAEILAGVGFDWLLFDMEHAPLTFEAMHQMMQAMGGSATTPLVRVPRNDSHLIGQALNGGAHGVMVPQRISTGARPGGPQLQASRRRGQHGIRDAPRAGPGEHPSRLSVHRTRRGRGVSERGGDGCARGFAGIEAPMKLSCELTNDHRLPDPFGTG
jgi:hypothetical protein